MRIDAIKNYTVTKGIYRNTNYFRRPLLKTASDEVLISFKRKTEPFNEAKIRSIYDETYKSVIRNHPILKDLNYKKPELVFEKEDMDDTTATYDFFDNSIRISPIYKENVYSYIFADEYGDITNISIIPGDNYKKSAQKFFPKIAIEKLNRSEKELFYKIMFAHELRHSIQAHVMFSTKGYGLDTLNHAKEINNKIIKETKKQVEILELEKLKGGIATYENIPIDEIIAGLKDSIKLHSNIYIANYKPKKIFNQDMLFKLSTHKNDHRYWSVKNHFCKSYAENNNNNNTASTYYSDPMELDAFNYEIEFISKLKPDKNIRPYILECLLEDLDTKTYFLNELHEHGYQELIIK